MAINKHPSTPYTLGLDIGIASVGAGLLADNHILALYVRTFDKAETAEKGESLNKVRRDARGVRRRLRRRAYRLGKLRELFVKQGLIPRPEAELFQTGISPWVLRAEGLDRLLKPEELAAVCYHLVKHRGFQSNRKSEVGEDEKAGKMLSGVERNRELLEQSGFRTVGELKALAPEFQKAKRNKYGDYTNTVSRSQIEDELASIFTAQRGLGSLIASDDLESGVHRWLMARRPVLAGDDLLKMVGQCTFEPGEFRAPRASYSFQRFAWLTKLNNLRLVDEGHERSLSSDERTILLNEPFTKAKLTYVQVRKLLGLPESASFKGLRYTSGAEDGKDPEKASLYEARDYHTLRKLYNEPALKGLWLDHSRNAELLDNLSYIMTVYKDDKAARAGFSEIGISAALAEKLLLKSFDKFGHLSLVALRKLIPHMEAGARYDEAVQLAGYEHHSKLEADGLRGYLPRLSRDAIVNPVVARALNQARKLVNAIVKRHGAPRGVHIELARDLSRSLAERGEIEKTQKRNRDARENDIVAFEADFGFRPKGLQFLKWRLYREQAGKCAYSLAPLKLERLFEDGYVEIDHALPYSRSFDDSLNNKVLVLTTENRNKGNKTPYEYLGGEKDTSKWHAYATWVSSNQRYRRAKKDKLLRKNFGREAAEEFRDRHLNDTRYICRAFKNQIDQHLLFDSDDGKGRCVSVNGQLTSYLRVRWGLLKYRKHGDLHHALDAAVVAACSRSIVKRLSDYSRRNELELAHGEYIDESTGEIVDIETLRKLEREFPQPWHHFSHELIARLAPDAASRVKGLDHYSVEMCEKVQPVRVSRALRRRGYGSAHAETIRSAKYLDQQKSTIRKDVNKLKLKDLENIVGYEDPRNTGLIERLRQRLLAYDDNPAKAFDEPIFKPTRSGDDGPEIKTVKIFTVQKSYTRVRGGVADNGDMLRVDVFEKDSKYFCVPLYVSDAVKQLLPNCAVVANKPEEQWPEMTLGYTFKFSLCSNDWVRVHTKLGVAPIEGYFSGLDRSTGAISLWAHDRDQRAGKNGLYRSIGVRTAVSFKKFHVDILGGLHRVHHERRQPLRRKG
tara:strand:- start:11302 stop:14520 length:3219 start_codon:yes stop_codon:yes gene_type:complete